jgi:serine/threonine-protein kinase SRPK3
MQSQDISNNLDLNEQDAINVKVVEDESASDSLSESSDDVSCRNNGNEFYGEVLNNNYLLIKKIGYGSFSSVWLSYGWNKRKFYAIKIQNAGDFEEGRDEVDILSKLSRYKCKYINNLITHFIEKRRGKKNVCMVFSLLAGSIYDIMKTGKYRHGLPIDVVKKIMKQTLTALDILHNKLNHLHSDLKPENIMIYGHQFEVDDIIKKIKKLNIGKMFFKEIMKYQKDKKMKIMERGKVKPKYMNIILKKINKYILSQLSEFELEPQNESESESDGGSESDSDESDSDYSSDSDDEPIIDDKYIQNCQVRLGDYGTVCDLTMEESDDEYEYDIQTRYYRAPEIILECPYNATCDMWSMGCILYELLTGEILFDPDKDSEYGRNTHHLVWMKQLLGDIPKKMIRKSKNKKLFDENHVLKYEYNIKKKDLRYLLLNRHQYSGKNVDSLINLLTRMLDYNPNTRLTVKECLKNEWLN